MKNFLISSVVFAALFAPSIASADQNTQDRSRAIQLCQTEVASQAGLDADSVRLDQVRLRARVVRVDFDIWRDGQLQNVRCDVTRGEQLQIASITPALGTAAAR